MARYKPVSYNQALMVPVILEKQLVPGTLEFAIQERIFNIIKKKMYTFVLIGKN